ncbi:histidinol-phosphate transaminase [Bifidobacterium eulemuris]|uniref:Histidinol-phosphate aminotransferase n=1 Tax=Bifidobacterium eulemuris TaxID=1765219 RepID=A0A7L9ST64_9BIFI|nr:histidinol-phosphate transaminase [Bifidobacterium eulemuris]
MRAHPLRRRPVRQGHAERSGNQGGPQVSDTTSNVIPANLPLRNDLIGEEPYGAPQLDVPVCLNVNENPYAPDPAVCETIAERVKAIAPTLNRYPDREHVELRQAFSDYLARESGVRLDVDELWGANGSNEIMLQLFQAFGGPGRTALGADPTYSMYPEYARDTFTGWELAHRNDDFTLNVDRLIERIEAVKPSMVLLTSPNNPTGTPLAHEDIERVLAVCETAEVAGAREGVHPIVVIDEAYIEFRDPGVPSAVELIKTHANLAVSRTMSKAFAFAGARVGYLAASKGIIDCVRIVRMPYHLSAVTQAAALAAFEHTDEQLSRVNHLRETRNATAAWLKQLTYKGQALDVADSQSNFLLFGGHLDNREAIFEGLLERGVLIRVVGPAGWLRVCMGTDEEMEAFRTALTEVLNELDKE